MDLTGPGDPVIADQQPKREPSKLRRSCESCRAFKGRCLPSCDDLYRCQRCVKDKKQCVFLQAKARPKREKSSRVRVAEMEQRLEGIFALLTSRAPVSADDTNLPDATSPPGLLSPYAPDTSSLPQEPEILTTTQRTPALSFSHLVLDDLQDVISREVIDFDKAAESVRFFQTKASTFPFVVLPSQVSLDYLRRERPFLLLTILTSASQSNIKVQTRLEQEIRESLGRKITVNGEKSLDLLQGLLIYLSCYHYVFDPKRVQIYQVMTMAVAMAIELGINRKFQRTSHTNFSLLNSASPYVDTPTRMLPEDIELMRTFVGCYYISSSVCVGLRRPCGLKYTGFIKDCTQMLTEAAVAETDYLLQYFIGLQRFAEEVDDAFDYSSQHQLPHIDTARTELLCKSFERQLDQLEMSFPPQAWNNTTITISYYALRILINEVGFHGNAPSTLELMAGPSFFGGWYFSSARSEALVRCLESTKAFLDRFLSFPSHEVRKLMLGDLLHLVYAFLVVDRFRTGSCASTSDAALIGKVAHLGSYLDALVSRFRDLVTVENGEDRRDWMYHMWRLFRSYQVTMETATSSEEFFNQKGLCALNILPPAIDIPAVCSTSDMCLDERWTDMIEDWSCSLDSVT